MRTAWFLSAALALSACTRSAPIIEYRTITASVPPALLAQEPPPVVPVCVVQSCIADFILDDRAWGERGWAQLAAVADALAPPEKTK